MQWQLALQALALLTGVAWVALRVALDLAGSLVRLTARRLRLWPTPAGGGATFYVGSVMHVRRAPKENRFTYPVRVALVDLDSPPRWWDAAATDTLTADQARALSSTKGPVRLLTTPAAAGYVQNPISVYYCYGPGGGSLERCIAEVTNTPWGERVTFCVRPGEETVPKALHVSPLMDMQNTWTLKTQAPGSRVLLSVAASHPVHGDYFLASLGARADAQFPCQPSEAASLGTLLRYGYLPQRVALWIYWQAAVLLWKGVAFHGPPCTMGHRRGAEAAARHPPAADGRLFVWRPALKWPWR